MALGDRFRRKSQPASAGTQPAYQPYPQQPPQNQPIPQQQPMAQPQPQPQQPPLGYMYDNYGRLIPDPRYAVPQATPAPQPQPTPPPQYIYDNPMQPQMQRPNGKPANKGSGLSLYTTIPSLLVMAMMAGGVIGCAYFSFLMKPFVSTTVIKWMPALLGLLFLMNGIGMFGLYLKK